MSQSLLHQVTYSDVTPTKEPKLLTGVSIPFTSGHVFRRFFDHLFQHKGLVVSIPFTSGHVFRRRTQLHRQPLRFRSLNPFYIRSRIPTIPGLVEPGDRCKVSIPFTSGHVFRHAGPKETAAPAAACLNPFYIRSRIPTPGKKKFPEFSLQVSQSLLHQVTYSDDQGICHQGS